MDSGNVGSRVRVADGGPLEMLRWLEEIGGKLKRAILHTCDCRPASELLDCTWRGEARRGEPRENIYFQRFYQRRHCYFVVSLHRTLHFGIAVFQIFLDDDEFPDARRADTEFSKMRDLISFMVIFESFGFPRTADQRSWSENSAALDSTSGFLSKK